MTEKAEYIYLETLGCGSIRLGKNLVTLENLKRLFQIEKPVLVEKNENVDEVSDFSKLQPKSVYVVLGEDDVDNVPEEEEEDKMTDEERHQMAHEFQNRRALRTQNMEKERRKFIKENYKPLNKEVFTLHPETDLIKEYVDVMSSGDKEKMLAFVKKETSTGIYSFRMFTDDFCTRLIQEVDHFERSGLPVMRPNSMNNYGVILEEIGFDEYFMQLLKYVRPLAGLLYGEIGYTLDDHHSFIVEYKIGEDESLDFHYDAAEVTINFCLGKEFTGGSLYFRGLLDHSDTHDEDFQFDHVKGLGIIHLGKHRHGANKIKSGERYNLIIWFRNKKLREEAEREMLKHGQCGCEEDHIHH